MSGSSRRGSFRAIAEHPAFRAARRMIVTVVGATLLAVGVAFLVLPGPAFVVIPVALGVLATEYVWARRLLERVRERLRRGGDADETDEAAVSEEPRPRVLVMAGARGGAREEEFVAACGAPHRALVEVAGEPILVHVLRAIRGTTALGPVHLSTDGRGEALARDAIARSDLAAPARWHRSAQSPAHSVLTALDDGLAPLPALVTTADHALLTPALLEDFVSRARATGADFVVGVVPADLVLERFSGAVRTLLRFRDETLCGANLYFLGAAGGRAAVETWTAVEADRKRPVRLLRHFGWIPALRFALRRLRFDEALEIASRRFGCRVAAVRLSDPEAAVDVDRVSDRDLVDSVLRARQAAPSTCSPSATTRSSSS